MPKVSKGTNEVVDHFAQSLTLARALGALIAQLRTVDPAQSAVLQREQVRRALRATVAASRRTSLDVRLVADQILIGERLLSADAMTDDPAIAMLVARLSEQGSLSLDVRRGAAPTELLELARLLGTDRSPGPSENAWRSWSVRITPGSVPVVGAGAEAPPASEAVAAAPEAVQHALSALATAHDDTTLHPLVETLLHAVSTPPWNEHPSVIEAVAIGLVSDARHRGNRAGRLTIESGIRQLLSPERLTTLVRRLPHTRMRDELLPVLARGGEYSVHALVQALQDAETLMERRVCFDAIVALDAGDGALREALTDARWFVVRNAAALLGEMGVLEADGELVALLSHADERIRVAGARSLTRLGTERALVALQQCLTDSVPELRRLAAAAHGARSQGKPSTTALLTALDIETDEDVMLEIVAVLGVLGSPDGVQRLLRLLRNDNDEAEPWLREAAYNALVVARGEGVAKHLEQ